MGNIESFEDIKAWQVAREITNNIYKLSSRKPFSNDWTLKDQMRRASISISSNIAEGFERGGNKELIQFLFIAKGSCGELRSQSYIALDCSYISKSEFEDLYRQVLLVSKMISGFIKYLKNTELKGTKFNEEELSNYSNPKSDLVNSPQRNFEP